jgi:AGCS family alanine or glycine:cation symporter
VTSVVIVLNIDKLPHVFGLIMESAFGVGPAAGGALGMTMMMGIKRGLFSNEAGEGSAPNVAATAHVSHPVKQGLVQALGVFTDTLVVCSCTAFIILLSGLHTDPTMNGIVLTQNALNSQIGSAGSIIVAFAILFFAYSSIIGNYYYGEANVRFLTKKRWVLTVFRLFSAGVMVMLGALASLDLVWSLGDVCMALVTAVNLVAIAALGKWAFRLLQDYRKQRRSGIASPTFSASQFPEIQDELPGWK